MDNIVNRADIKYELFASMLETEAHHDHPIVLVPGRGEPESLYRWKETKAVSDIVKKMGGLNVIWEMWNYMKAGKNDEFVRSLYRHIGYSLYGYWEIFYRKMNNPIASEYRKEAKPVQVVEPGMAERLSALEKVVSEQLMPQVKELDGLVADLGRKSWASVFWDWTQRPAAPETVNRPDPVIDPSPPIDWTLAAAKDYLAEEYANARIKLGLSWAVQPGASPQNIPFSVALEYMKTMREVRRLAWRNETLRIQPQGICGAGGFWKISGASLNVGQYIPSHEDLLATDWCVLPEEPQTFADL